jgi:hypothetical protein
MILKKPNATFDLKLGCLLNLLNYFASHYFSKQLQK